MQVWQHSCANIIITTSTTTIVVFCLEYPKSSAVFTWYVLQLERERGITISSAAISLQVLVHFQCCAACSVSRRVQWRQHHINLVDTPGHIDFTIEARVTRLVLRHT